MSAAPLDVAAVAPIMFAMFAAGLLGGVSHCATMCGPFVLAQTAVASGRMGPAATGLTRIRGGLLVPYHLGRLTTYALLGATAGGLSGVVVKFSGFAWVLAGFLILAAMLFLRQALAGLALRFPALRTSGGSGATWTGMGGWFGALLARPLRPFFAAPRGLNGYVLGLALGFLPCGLLYAALASAVGMGGAVAGFLVMAAFALGTVPGLVAVGLFGAMATARWRGLLETLTPALMLINAGVLLNFALHAVRS